MKKSPFLIFAFVMALLISGIISFIQSPRFARVVKAALTRYVPADVGIEGDFSELQVKLFPPGISIRDPRIRVLERNFAGLPPGSSINAERVDFEFRPVQMFSGNIRVHEVTVVNGDVNLILGDLAGTGAKRPKKRGFHWDELFQIHAEAISLRNTKLHVEAKNPALTADLTADTLRVGQWSGKGGLGYELELALSRISGSFLKTIPAPASLDRVKAVAHINAAGLRVDSLEAAAADSEVSARGQVKGNLLDPKNLALDAEVSAKGDLERAFEILVKDPRKRPRVGGVVSFVGRLRGAPDRLMETLKVEGALAGSKVRYQQWAAESLKAELGWQASVGGGELAVTKAVISSPERQRSLTGGAQPGDGGRIEVGAFKLNLASLKAGSAKTRKLDQESQEDEEVEVPRPAPAFSVPLALDRVHLHWLAAPVIQAVYGLDLRATGPVTLAFRPAVAGRSWDLEAKFGLSVQDFQLDNQKLGQAKPLHKILQVPRIRLEGGAIIDSGSFRPVDLSVSTGQTSFKGSGKVDFKSGFDLRFAGQANLEDVGQIAETDIRGHGALAVHVRGAAPAVFIDFDPDLKGAQYLRLNLGDVAGRITWDDGLDRLLFTRMRAKRGESDYQAEGFIDLAPGKDSIAMDVKVPRGKLQDLLPVFDQMTHDIWWYPRGLRGGVAGDVRISGGIAMNKLVVDARVTGSDWDYWGERFTTVSLQGGYDRGKYQVVGFHGVKRLGQVAARISYDTDRVIDWGIHTDGMTVGDFDHVAALDVPIRGRVRVESSGKGKDGSIKSSTTIRLDEVSVRGAQMPASELRIFSDGGKADIHGTALGGQGTLEAVYDFNPGGSSSLKSSLKDLDFTPAMLLINPRLIQDRAASGRISGMIDIRFPSGQLERASGGASLTEYQLSKSGTRFALAHPVSFKLADGSFDQTEISLRGNEGEATLAIQSRRGEIEGTIFGGLDTSIVEFLTPVVSDSNGLANLDFALGGTVKAPTVFGKATFDGVSLRIPALESPFENVSGALQLKQNVVYVQNVQGDLAGGRVTAEGSVQLFADRVPQIALKGNLAGNKLKVFPFQFIKVHGGLEVRGDKLPYQVDGAVTIESALSKEKIFNQRKGDGLKALQYTPPPASNRPSDYPKFKLNIDAVADGNVIIQNELFDAEARGKFTVVNTIEAPRVLGTAEVVSGRMIFKDRAFQIQSANAVFDNPTVINPSFSLTASTDIDGTKILMYASGRMDSLKVELSSNPAMPENEILSLLALGMTSGDAKRLSATDRSVFEQGEAASLLLHSLDFNREMQKRTGLQIQLDESVTPQQQGTSVFKPQTGAESVATPKIVIRREIGKRFELSYGTTISGGPNASSGTEVNAEYRLTPGLSVQGVWNSYQAVDAQDRRNSLGLDLKFQTRFK